MRGGLRILLGLLLVLGALPAPAQGADPSSFAALKSKAEAEGATAEGRRYFTTMTKPLQDALGSAIGKCQAELARAPLSTIELVLSVGADGKPLDAVVHPENESMTCIGNELRTVTFPKPPHDRFLAYIYTKLGG